MTISRAVSLAQDIHTRGRWPLPVDVYAVAAEHGVMVREEELEDSISGFLALKEGRRVVVVNANHHANRRRFTVAHECGHFLLHGDPGRVFVDASPIFFRDDRSSQGIDRREMEANAFAAELLMPEEELRARVARPIDVMDEVAVRRLASQFGVSPQALTIRLTTLGLFGGLETRARQSFDS